jgi:hypothetical protein
VNGRIAIDLARRRLQDFRAHTLRQVKHIDRPDDTRFGGLHRVVLVMNGRRGTGEIVNLVNLNLKGDRHIVTQSFKMGLADEMRDILFAAREIVVHAQHIIAFTEKALTKMRSYKTRTASHEDSLTGHGYQPQQKSLAHQ